MVKKEDAKSVRLGPQAHAKLMKIQGIIQLQEEKSVSMDYVLLEMVKVCADQWKVKI